MVGAQTGKGENRAYPLGSGTYFAYIFYPLKDIVWGYTNNYKELLQKMTVAEKEFSLKLSQFFLKNEKSWNYALFFQNTFLHYKKTTLSYSMSQCPC